MTDLQITYLLAAALAGTTGGIALAALAKRAKQATQDHTEAPAAPPVVTPEPQPHHPQPSLKLTRVELLQHARALGVKNARWRNSAKKVDLVLAIREHNEARRQGQ